MGAEDTAVESRMSFLQPQIKVLLGYPGAKQLRQCILAILARNRAIQLKQPGAVLILVVLAVTV